MLMKYRIKWNGVQIYKTIFWKINIIQLIEYKSQKNLKENVTLIPFLALSKRMVLDNRTFC